MLPEALEPSALSYLKYLKSRGAQLIVTTYNWACITLLIIHLIGLMQVTPLINKVTIPSLCMPVEPKQLCQPEQS